MRAYNKAILSDAFTGSDAFRFPQGYKMSDTMLIYAALTIPGRFVCLPSALQTSVSCYTV